MDIDTAGLEDALQVLGNLLADRGQHYEIAAIGGGSLLLLGLITRTTKDLDLVALIEENELVSVDPMPQALARAVDEVGQALELGKGWLNAGPASLLKKGLPFGFMTRLHIREYKGLTVYLADRFDQICFKLYASVDQGPQSKHYIDLIALKPTYEELEKAKNWCITHDPSEPFEKDLNCAIKSIYASQ